jgi:hypothetical protein
MADVVEPFPTDLDRSLLHLFVFGSDVGEAIAVALPNRGWLLVDGCRLEIDGEEVFPALEAFERLQASEDDRVELLVWTHPHADHYQGIREAVERYRPLRVGITMIEAPPPGSAYAELEAIGTHPVLPADLQLRDVFTRVRTTFERIYLHWRESPASRLPLSTATPPLNLGSVRVKAFSPDPAALAAFYSLGVDGLRHALRSRANEFSVVLGVEFGDTRIVLGGDLPHRAPSGSLIEHAWKSLEANSPELADHDGFKVSHHGSAEAIPPSFKSRAAPPREWLVTPFAREHLPRPGDDVKGGLRQLLHRVPALRLTSSVGLVSPGAPGQTITRQLLRDKLAAIQASGFSSGLRAPSPTSPFDFSWGIAFDAGRCAKRLFAGAHAVTIVEAPTP